MKKKCVNCRIGIFHNEFSKCLFIVNNAEDHYKYFGYILPVNIYKYCPNCGKKNKIIEKCPQLFLEEGKYEE